MFEIEVFRVMNQINQNQIKWDEVKSPRGKFHLFRRHISLALGGRKDTGPWGGGHPFDLELTRIPPGATNWPYHAHAAQWELYVILSGCGQVRTPDGHSDFGPGNCFVVPPGEPHQLRNTGVEDLLFYLIADNSPADITNYPDSGKWNIKPQRKIFKMTEMDYYQDEE